MLAPPPALVAQAGSPLHKILNSVSPATGQQLTNLFALLQSNAVTPSEFLAQAERLLEPAQFEILDGIRRRHPPAVASDRSAASGTPGSAALSPAGSSTSTPTPAVVTPGSSSTVSTPAATPGPSTVPLLPPARATISPAMPSLPNVATPPSRVTPSTPTANANVITPALPPAPSTTQPTSQSAPVRKRNTDATANTPGSEAISKPTKRVKTDASIPTPGAGASVALTPALPSTGGPSTPASGAPSPGAFNRVSLPGQQKAAATPTPGAASAAQAGVSTGAGSSAAKSSTAVAAANEKTNYDNITDVMGYVGVDLKEETDNIMRDNDGYSKSGSGADGQDRTRVQNFVNAAQLKAKIERIASLHKLTVEADVLTYLAMAAQERLRGLAEQMIHASKHRGLSQSTTVPPLYDEDHAMYMVGVTQDVKKQLLAIERVEREEEFKRKEMIAERERKAALGEDLDENGEPRAGAGAGGAGSGSKKKKQKEGGPGVSARNMTEEARKKVANQTALGFAGGSGRTYSWMMGAGGAGGAGGGGAGGAGGAGAGGGGAASPMPSTSSGAASASSPAASGSSKPSLTRTTTMPASTPSISVGGGSPGHASGAGSPSLSRGVSVGGGSSMVLPPSTLGRPASLRDTSRKVNVKDALFCLERDRGGGGGEGSGQRVLVKSYVKWLK
ncbi:hypothetical protein BGZ52_006678 [Haplosporangium bisporale]|nr:hypothetical protein BGZ52_006678 [Haplosporangium bisporale]